MDINHNQTAQMITWLDEERRKDKSTITRLEERVNSQAAVIEDQKRRLQQMESDMVTLKTMMISPGTFNETVTKLRGDLLEQIKNKSENKQSSVSELKKLRELDREAYMKGLEEVRQEIVSRIERELQPRRAEEERLSRVAFELQSYSDNLKKGLEEFERTLAFLEEQRRQDSRRISVINSEISELTKRVDTQSPKTELLEELSRRNERVINDLSGSLTELNQSQKEWSEREGVLAQERERTMNDMVRRMDAFNEEMDGYEAQFSQWATMQHTLRTELEEFNRIADRVDRRLNELAEVQRLSEDRFRQEWEQWQQEDQKRWRQFTVTNDEQWRENEKRYDGLLADIAKLNERTAFLSDNISAQRDLQQKLYKSMLSVITEQKEEAELAFKNLPSNS